MKKLILLLGLTLMASLTLAQTWSVTLTDGAKHEGNFIRIEPGRYLLQTDDTLYELTDDDLDPETFSIRRRSDAAPKRRLIERRDYVELHADGTGTFHWEMKLVNDTSKAITELRFGYAPWEREVADQRTYRDPFGNVLVPEYDPPRHRWADKPDQRVQVSLPLPVPVAPGETMTINADETSHRIQMTADGLLYNMNGDYPENRLVWHKVRLPQGARISSINPEPVARFEQDGFEYVMWRRYYVKGEVAPLTVLYTLD